MPRGLYRNAMAFGLVCSRHGGQFRSLLRGRARQSEGGTGIGSSHSAVSPTLKAMSVISRRFVPVIGVGMISISRLDRLADRHAAEWSLGGAVSPPGPEAV